MLPVLETIAVEIEPNPDVIAEAETLTIQPEEEAQLTAEVESLWAEHQKVTATKKTSSAELRQIRQELGRKLFECKQLLARPGRGGEWSGWLKERGISRATADRWVNRHVESIGQPDNRVTEATSESEVAKFLKSVLQKGNHLLPHKRDKYDFLFSLAEGFCLDPVDDDGLLISEPELSEDEIEPPADEPGDDLFMPSGSSSDEVPAREGAEDNPAIISGEQKRQIEL